MTPHAIPERIVTFGEGLPGFEAYRRFVLIASPSLDPFTLLQGAGPDAPSFVGIDPVLVDPGYRMPLAAADRRRLEARPGDTLLWLALVAARPDGTATVNLRAPVVINPASMRGIQVLAHDSAYRLIILSTRPDVLVFTRKLDEAIVIGDGIEIRVLRIGRDGVRLGVTAAPEVPVHRLEVYDQIRSANASAAAPPGAARDLVTRLKQHRDATPAPAPVGHARSR